MPTTLSERAAGAVIRKRLSAHGWDEVQTYVFTDPVWSERLGWAADEVVTLVNALAADQGIMRRSLLPTLLEAVGRNRRYLNQVSCTNWAASTAWASATVPWPMRKPCSVACTLRRG